MKTLSIICFYIPFVFNVLNLQTFIAKFVSYSLGQISAYINVILVMLGIFLFIKEKRSFPKIVNLWIVFFILYYCIGLIASIILDNYADILRTMVPITYFFGYSIFLSIPEEREKFSKIIPATFLMACVLLIILQQLNFSLDHDGIYEYNLSRAGGVYGDANNAAVVCILSFILLKNEYNPSSNLLKILKIIGLIISVYALFLTFSQTGFVVFFIVLCLVYHKLFQFKKLLLLIICLPFIVYSLFNAALSSSFLNKVQKGRIESIVNLLTLNTDKVSLSERDVLLKNMLNYVYENPILGNGINFSVVIRGHNTIIGVWADAGIFTFLFFLFLLFTYFKDAILASEKIRFYVLPMIFTLSVFMLSLQTIINQAYLMVLFVYIGFLLDNKNKIKISTDYEKMA